MRERYEETKERRRSDENSKKNGTFFREMAFVAMFFRFFRVFRC